MADYNISLGVTLETDALQKIKGQINKLETDPVKIQLDTSQIQNQINNIKTQLQSLGNIKINLGSGTGKISGLNSGSQKIVNDANWAYKQLLDIQKRANTLNFKITGLDTSRNVNELRELSQQLNKLKADYNTLRSLFGSQLSPIQLGNLQAEVTETDAKIAALNAKIKDTKTNLAASIQGNFGNYDAQVAKLETGIGRLATTTPKLEAGLTGVKQALAALKSADSTEALISANERYQKELRETRAELAKNVAIERSSNNSIALTQAKQNMSLKMSNWLKENSAATKQFGAEIQNLQAQLNNCGNIKGVQQIGQAFQGITMQAKAAGVATQTLGDRLKTQISKYSTYFSGYMLFSYATQALRSMFEQVKLVDSAMTELKKVTNESDDSYAAFLDNAGSRAKELGTTVDGLVSSTSDFARLGYSFKEAQGLAEVANIYAVVGDDIENVEQATESLISTMSAFKEEMGSMSDSQFAMSIIDVFNELGNKFAISSGGIGEAFERSASSMAAANNTFHETAALITAANTVVQNPEQVGNAMKTKFFNCLYVQKCA